jgi:long-chain acyl-CoA synthetase
MTDAKLILDQVYDHEVARASQVFLTQPIGGGAVTDYTWQQTVDQARRMAAHLSSLHLEPGARIAILSKNCAHFFMAELAIWMAGGTTVAIFPTETAATVRFVLEHSEASLLFVGKLDTWDQQLPGVPAGLPRIAFPLAPAAAQEAYNNWDTITGCTPPLGGRPQRLPSDLAMLVYTSGSTGQPKGVVHNFECISKVMPGVVSSANDTFGDDTSMRMLSYLPLAHIFERCFIECLSFYDGRQHVFFAESVETFTQDLQRARPTFFLSVPRLWIKFQQGVFAKMPPKKLDRLLAIPIVGKLVARKILRALGLDQVKLAGSGSAPLPAELIVWYRKLGLNLLEGYAMSEDFAYSHISTREFKAPGYVGVPYPGVQIRINAQSEIEIKSPGQMVGYYKRPDLDAESFTADGFFKTGDLGERLPNGLLKITGRSKELFKTAKGKYVAPAPIENRINCHPMVESSMVSGLGQAAAYGLVVLAEDMRPKMGDPAVRAEVTAAMTELLHQVNSSVAEYEHLHMLVIAREPWSIDNGCLTPTMKIKRSRIEASVAPAVGAWYATQETVLWA